MKDVVLSLRYEDEPSGSLYNDDGTEKIFATRTSSVEAYRTRLGLE